MRYNHIVWNWLMVDNSDWWLTPQHTVQRAFVLSPLRLTHIVWAASVWESNCHCYRKLPNRVGGREGKLKGGFLFGFFFPLSPPETSSFAGGPTCMELGDLLTAQPSSFLPANRNLLQEWHQPLLCRFLFPLGSAAKKVTQLGRSTWKTHKAPFCILT